MSAKHTPGPWLVFDEAEEGDAFAHSEWPHVMTNDGYAVCDLCDWGSLTLEAQIENARLIAAAPSLYSLAASLAALADGLNNGNSSAEVEAVKLAEQAAKLVQSIDGEAA